MPCKNGKQGFTRRIWASLNNHNSDICRTFSMLQLEPKECEA